MHLQNVENGAKKTFAKKRTLSAKNGSLMDFSYNSLILPTNELNFYQNIFSESLTLGKKEVGLKKGQICPRVPELRLPHGLKHRKFESINKNKQIFLSFVEK